MHERHSEAEPDVDVALVECVCGGRPRIGGDACDDCAGVYRSVLLLLRQNARNLSGNPIWILAWALARVVGSERMNWDAIRSLAAQFEDSESIH